ncbi:MAG: response regulator [Deltaproteobacteria bacterium]
MGKNNNARILVVDDESQIRKLLRVALSAYGYEVKEVNCGQDGLREMAIYRPDLVILDLGLPDMDGLEILKQLREWSPTPVLILSVKEQEQDKITALDAGADDYVSKPFSMGELLARIRTALRHSYYENGENPILFFNDLEIDIVHRKVKLSGNEVKLTPTEYEILKNMAIHSGKVITHRQLLTAIWGKAYENDTHYLRVYIGQLRKKIEIDPSRPKHIITESGVGYRLL